MRILGEAGFIAAEDTRHTRKLLTHHGISSPMISYWGVKEKLKAAEVLQKLRQGQTVALVTDAGTPGISDPGGVLISQAYDEGFHVVSVPGASALTAAVSVSGLRVRDFTFIGFLSAKKGQRRAALEALKLEPRTLVFYESPHRIIDCLIDMEELFGPERHVSVVHELTKMHEEVIRGTLREVLDALEDATVAGEYVVVVQGHSRGEGGTDEALQEVLALIGRGMGRKESAKKVARQYGLSAKVLYDGSLDK